MVSDHFAEYRVVAEVYVLILVLMEYGLGHYVYRYFRCSEVLCLNPCFNGIWSRTTRIKIFNV